MNALNQITVIYLVIQFNFNTLFCQDYNRNRISFTKIWFFMIISLRML